MARVALSEQTRTTLRLADRRLRTADRGDDAFRYTVVRNALSGLARVDSFYVGLYRPENTLLIPYAFEEGTYQGAQLQHFGPHGLSHWLRASRRPYRWSEDRGALANRGLTSSPFYDVVVAPMIDPANGDVLGMLGVQSREPDSYDDELALAVSWLARALVAYQERDRADLASDDLFDIYPELNSSVADSRGDAAEGILTHLAAVQRQLRNAQRDGDAEQLDQAVTDVLASCQAMERLVETMLEQEKGTSSAPVGLDSLTVREKEIADLIALEGLRNPQIAARLFISEKTVKVHVGNVLRKLGAAQRSEIRWMLRGEKRA